MNPYTVTPLTGIVTRRALGPWLGPARGARVDEKIFFSTKKVVFLAQRPKFTNCGVKMADSSLPALANIRGIRENRNYRFISCFQVAA